MSFRAAFAAGADIVEFDVHPTTDGHFVVFHDWTARLPHQGSGVQSWKTTKCPSVFGCLSNSTMSAPAEKQRVNPSMVFSR